MKRNRTTLLVFAALIISMAAFFVGCEDAGGGNILFPVGDSSSSSVNGDVASVFPVKENEYVASGIQGDSSSSSVNGDVASETQITVNEEADSGTSAAPVYPPPAPDQPRVTSSYSQLTVEWDAISGADSYEVWKSTSEDIVSAAKYGSDITETSAAITGLTNGTTYYIWVRAKNSEGPSDFSPAVSGTPAAPVPAAPGRPRVTSSDSQLTVEWDAVSGADSYEVWKSTTNNSASAHIYSSDITETSAAITGLTNGTTYYIWVRAKNSEGPSDFSPAASGTPAVPVPAAPAQLRVTPAAGQLTVQWDAVEGAVSYEVWTSTTSSIASAAKYGNDITETSIVITGLTNGTTHYVWVKAKNSVGTTSGFSPVGSETPAAPVNSPAAPNKPVVSAGNGSLTVEWNAVSGATSYELWTSTTNNIGTAEQYGGGLNITKITITGLTNGTSYYVWVKAINDLGQSGISPAASGKPVAHYQLSYVTNGGTFSGGTPAGSIGYQMVVTLPAVTRTGYTLKDLTLSGALSGTFSPGDSFFMPAGAVTVTANWTPIQYQLSYDENGGTLSGGTAAGSILYGTTVTLPSSGTITEGYTLKDFTLGGVLTGTKNPGATFAMPAGAVTVIANWTRNTYQLSYNGNGETLSGGTTEGGILYGATVTLPTSGTKTGYMLTNFSLSGALTDTKNPGSSFAMPAGAVTVTANWTLNSYQLSYDDNGGTLSGGTTAGSIGYGTSVTLPTSGTKPGQTLTGFTLSGALTGTKNPGGTFTMPAGAVTVTANWHNDSGISITLGGGAQEEAIDWTNNPAAGISWRANDSLTVTVNTASNQWANGASFTWSVDGTFVNGAAGNTLTIHAQSYAEGTHTLTVYVTKNGVSYSKTVRFTVAQ